MFNQIIIKLNKIINKRQIAPILEVGQPASIKGSDPLRFSKDKFVSPKWSACTRLLNIEGCPAEQFVFLSKVTF